MIIESGVTEWSQSPTLPEIFWELVHRDMADSKIIPEFRDQEFQNSVAVEVIHQDVERLDVRVYNTRLHL